MASTYSDLKIELIGTGEQVGTWGSTTNTNLGTAIEEAITGSADVAFSSADVTLTLTNTNGTQTARNLRLVCTGTSGGARNLILGSGCQIEKLYLIQNDLADAVTVKNTTGTGVTVAAGRKQFVFNDGTNVVEATSNIVDLTSDVTGTLPIANGGTNATATPTQGGITYGTGTAYAFTSAGTAGQALISDGTSAPTWQNVDSANTAGAIVERDGSGNFSAGTITAALTGAATQVNINATTSSDTSTYPVLVGAASTGGQTPFVDTGLSYNANTNALTATTFVGALSGNATTASAWQTARTLSIGGTGKSVSGSGNVTWSSAEITAGKLSTASGSAPSYSARAWVNFNGTGTPAIRASGNVSSITDNGTGEYALNFTTAMQDVNYAVAFTSQNENGVGNTMPNTSGIFATSNLTTSVKLVLTNFNSGLTDVAAIYGVIFR